MNCITCQNTTTQSKSISDSKRCRCKEEGEEDAIWARNSKTRNNRNRNFLFLPSPFSPRLLFVFFIFCCCCMFGQKPTNTFPIRFYKSTTCVMCVVCVHFFGVLPRIRSRVQCPIRTQKMAIYIVLAIVRYVWFERAIEMCVLESILNKVHGNCVGESMFVDGIRFASWLSATQMSIWKIERQWWTW